MTETTGSADSVEVGLSVPWEVEVDDDIDRKDVDSTGEDVCADEASCFSVLEVVVDPVRKN